MNVAQLKCRRVLSGRQRKAGFPRLNERGSIEVWSCTPSLPRRETFPRLNERGSIEGFLSVWQTAGPFAFPRLNERGSIEGSEAAPS